MTNTEGAPYVLDPVEDARYIETRQSRYTSQVNRLAAELRKIAERLELPGLSAPTNRLGAGDGKPDYIAAYERVMDEIRTIETSGVMRNLLACAVDAQNAVRLRTK